MVADDLTPPTKIPQSIPSGGRILSLLLSFRSSRNCKRGRSYNWRLNRGYYRRHDRGYYRLRGWRNARLHWG